MFVSKCERERDRCKRDNTFISRLLWYLL